MTQLTMSLVSGELTQPLLDREVLLEGAESALSTVS